MEKVVEIGCGGRAVRFISYFDNIEKLNINLIKLLSRNGMRASEAAAPKNTFLWSGISVPGRRTA
jgi:hypothetical protein